jgi:hypothetical protein
MMTCSICGALLEADGDQRPLTGQLCPTCQTKPRASISLAGNIHGTTSITAKLVDYPDSLMQEADKLRFPGKQPGLAIVVAHTACEVATQRAFARASAHRRISDLEDAVDGLCASYNLANPKVQQFYSALTGDSVQKESWWKDFKDSSQLRNDIVHEGRRATDAEAAASLTVCDKFVTHVGNYALPPRT